MFLRGESATDDLPAALVGLPADAGPAVLLVREQVPRTLDVGDYVTSLSLESGCTCSHSAFDVHSAFYSQRFRAFVITENLSRRRTEYYDGIYL